MCLKKFNNLPASIIFSSIVTFKHLNRVLIIIISALHKKAQETTDEFLGLKYIPTHSATVLNTLNINKIINIVTFYKVTCF